LGIAICLGASWLLLAYKVFTSGIAIDFGSMLGVLLMLISIVFIALSVPEEKGKRPKEH
jgi:hypothetical protein